MGKGLKVYLAALTQGMFTIKVADMAADNGSGNALLDEEGWMTDSVMASSQSVNNLTLVSIYRSDYHFYRFQFAKTRYYKI